MNRENYILVLEKDGRTLKYNCPKKEIIYLLSEAYQKEGWKIVSYRGKIIDHDNVKDKINSDNNGGAGIENLSKVKKPSMWNVIMFDDDYTPTEFVAQLLYKIFHKSEPESILLLEDVHKNGKVVVASYTHEVAEQKIIESFNMSRRAEHPLRFTIEEI